MGEIGYTIMPLMVLRTGPDLRKCFREIERRIDYPPSTADPIKINS